RYILFAKKNTLGKHFVDKYRIKLIERVSNIAAILDELLEEDVIQEETYDKIRVLPTCQDKMRELYSGPLKAGGIKVKDKFYTILEKKERFLVDELKEMK
uniref:CARD domain-containing protein n=1 Tax=Sander lucioperca TaxID=283035 RepID=A0A8C9Y5F8_SANLU